jgi:hypothetical protein
VGEAVRLTVVPGLPEAEVVCALLRGEGIRCAFRATHVAAGFSHWQEVLVADEDLAGAQALLDAEPEPGVEG